MTLITALQVLVLRKKNGMRYSLKRQHILLFYLFPFFDQHILLLKTDFLSHRILTFGSSFIVTSTTVILIVWSESTARTNTIILVVWSESTARVTGRFWCESAGGTGASDSIGSQMGSKALIFSCRQLFH